MLRSALVVLALTLTACGGSGIGEPVAVPAAVPTFAITGATAQVEVGSALRLGSGISPDTAGFTYRWDFGDGSSSNAPTPEKTYTSPGAYSVSLTITGAAGDTRSANVNVVAGRYALAQGLQCTGSQSNTGWCRVPQLPFTLGAPQFVDANNGWVLGAGEDIGSKGMVFRTTDGGQSWTPHPVGTSSFMGLAFVDARVGLLVSGKASGYGAWTTNDSGVTWTRRGTFPYLSEESAAPEWASADGMRILVRRENQNPFMPDPAKPLGYYLTRDGGATWLTSDLAAAVTPSGTLFQVDGNRVLRSTDFGQTSTVTPLSDAQTLRLVAFSGDARGWVFGINTRSEPTLWRTVNGGSTWTRVDIAQSTDRPGPRAGHLKAYDPQTLWTSEGLSGFPNYRSSDGGATWVKVAAPDPGPLAQVRAPTPVSADVAYAGTDLLGTEVLSIPLTVDGGRSWNNIPVSTALKARRTGSLQLVLPGGTAATMLLRYDAEEWYRSVDGGANWVQVLGPRPEQVVADGFPTDIWFVDSLRWNTSNSMTTDSGRSWTSASALPSTIDRSSLSVNRSNLQYRSGGLGWAVPSNQSLLILRTTDGGVTWQPGTLPPTGTLTGTSSTKGLVSFINDREGWALRSTNGYEGGQRVLSSAIWSTTDGGVSWHGLGTGPSLVNPPTFMAFVNASTGFVASSDGSILQTRDGGRTWQVSAPAEVGYDRSTLLGRFYFVNESLGFSIGTNKVRRTTDGGTTWTSIALGVDGSTADLGINDIRFGDARTGWMVGSAGLVLSTKDGGLTWTRQDAGSVTDLVGVYATDARTAWVVDRRGRPLVTATGGD